MPKSANAQFQKVIKTCPYCKTEGPKELVEGEKKKQVSWPIFFFLVLFTAGFGLIFVPLWYRAKGGLLQAWCPVCNKGFKP